MAGVKRTSTPAAVLDVYLNDRKLCRAGVGPTGVLSAIVSWVKLEGAAAATARRLEAPLEEAHLHVGGLRAETHRSWSQRPLANGDRVAVVLTRAARWDPPARTSRNDPNRRRREERAYYRRLKEKFEGTGGLTRFLNVDLDVYASEPLDALVAAFGKDVIVLHVGKEGRRYSAHLELAVVGRDPNRALRRFAARVASLPPAALRLWKRAAVREFNVGVQSAIGPHRFEWRIDSETLMAIARVNARLGTTVYGASGA
jgi:hypothetical protein